MNLSSERKATIAWEKHLAKQANRRKAANRAARAARRQQRKGAGLMKLREYRFILKSGVSFTVICEEVKAFTSERALVGYKVAGEAANRPVFIDVNEIAAILDDGPFGRRGSYTLTKEEENNEDEQDD